ncbi:hypothetical protein [Streptomyces justiciae]|uniref:hypothetical protein n=1 Tax=Streptomyces justiciae TaxID=2780140 RepID=UPI002118A694|nr:hypothetical protein [Streptomyces justiciae]MCW8382431.1 hypothetical protein [Streptomyces justiciae]
MVEQARRIAAQYESRVTLRQPSAAVLPALCGRGDPEPGGSYRKLSAKLAASVRAGEGQDLVDLTRHVHVPACWPDAGAVLADTARAFRLDRTLGQPVALYLCSEKDTLRVLFEQWVGDLGIPVLVSRGYGSESYIRTVRDRARAERRPTVLVYVGDADASGEDVMRDFIARTGCWDRIEHVALTVVQARAAELPAAVGKAADPRWPAFARRHDLDPTRQVQWEVEALDPEVLHRLVLDVVDQHTDRAALANVLAEEQRQRRALDTALQTWQDQSGEA